MPITGTNIKWYYSGGASNSDPTASIGGVISSVEVSTSIHGLFDVVTGTEATGGDINYRCVFVKNTDADADGLLSPKIFIVSDSSSADTSIAIGLDPAGKDASAATPANESTAPAGVSFSAPMSYAAGLALPSSPYAQNAYHAVWIRRTVNAGAAIAASDATTIRCQGDTI
jgi:hypothetical protein